jgi:WD40 repeat protein
MVQAGRTFRVFVSSTFSDLKEERNALQEHVWPKLRELCRKHGARFQAIDLRWGVSEEASRDQRTMDICLGELERCQRVTPRPNFVVLLGDRYGWRPLPAHLPADEFEAIRTATAPADQRLIDEWYRRDDNAVPAAYVLLPRATDAHDHEWPMIEREVRRVLLAGITVEQVAIRDRSIYEASATEQEIERGALCNPDAREHVVCMFREIRGLPPDSSAQDFRDLDESGAPDDEARGRLQALKRSLRGVLGTENVLTLGANWARTGPTIDHLHRLCREVLGRLSKTIQAEIARLEHEDQVAQESRAHADFGADRVRQFVGCEEALRGIKSYLTGSVLRPLLVHGASGSGKSTLMAEAARRAVVPGRTVVVRFLGVTPASSEGRGLLDGLCRQIARAYGVETDEPPRNYGELLKEFPKHLALATAKRPLVLFLDALDQLSEEDLAAEVSWLPRELPLRVRLVVSVTDGDLLERLSRRFPDAPSLALSGLPSTEGEVLLERWLAEAGRTLTPPQRDTVLQAFEVHRLPLHLRIAFEQAKRWRSFDERESLPSDIPNLIRRLFAELAAESNHGALLVERSLGLLAAARHGLSEDEMLDVLSADEEVLADFQHRSPQSPEVKTLPVVAWSRLSIDVAPYLTERAADGSMLFGFYHRQLREVVETDYLAADKRTARHAALAHYFGSLLPRESTEATSTFHLRPLAELCFQQRRAGLIDATEATLLENFEFLEAKAEAGLVFDLVLDFSEAIGSLPSNRPKRRLLVLMEEALRRDIHFIARRPTTLFQCLWNTCWWYDCSEAAKHYPHSEGSEPRAVAPWNRSDPKLSRLLESWRHHKEERTPGFGWLLSVRPPRIPLGTAQLAVLRGHTGDWTRVAFSPDSRRVASANADGTVRVWDVRKGTELAILRGHQQYVECVAYSPDGHWIASAGSDKTLRIWDAESGKEMAVLKAHEWVESVAWSPDGRRLASGGWDTTVRVWDTGTGRERLCCRGHEETIHSIAWSPDGRSLASGSDDKTIRVWDTESGNQRQCLRGHEEEVQSVAWSPDSRWLASGSWDMTVRVWDAATGIQRQCLRGHARVSSVAWSPGGRRILTGSDDHNIRVWDPDDGALLAILHGHEWNVTSVAFSPDGALIASGSADYTVRLWDAQANAPPLVLKNHEDLPAGERIELAVQYSPNGERIATGGIDQTIRLWDARTGVELAVLRGHEDGVLDISFSPDGGLIASAGGDSKACVWDARDGTQLMILEARGAVRCVSFSADGKCIATGDNAGEVRVWDVRSGAEGTVLTPPEEQGWHVSAVCFSPDGCQIAAAGETSTLYVWNAQSGALTRVLKWEVLTEFTRGISYSPDGSRVVVQNGDEGTVVLDVASGALLETIQGIADCHAIAGGTASFPLRARSIGVTQGLIVEPATPCAPVAYYASYLERVVTHPRGWSWAGSTGNHLHIVTLDVPR